MGTIQNTSRSRAELAIALCAVIALGLTSRSIPYIFPAILGKYPGDALWALMVFAGFAFVWPDAGTIQLATAAVGISYTVEFSQLYQTPWLNEIRNNPVGHLVLGSTFSWLDIVAYTVGIAIGMIVDVFWMALISRQRTLQPRRLE